MIVAVKNHQNKARQLIQALTDHGIEVVDADARADVLLVDYDGPVANYQRIIEKHKIQGAQVYLYQHGAMPMTTWDGITEPSDRVSGFLALASGHKWVMESYGYPHPIHVVGWYYCDILPWQKVERPRRVLFAPWHPLYTGFLPQEGKNLNVAIFADLLTLDGIELRLRHIHPIHFSGLQKVRGVEYVPGLTDNSHDDIDWADVVISHGTFAYLSIARGKPTVMYGQNHRPYDGKSEDNYREVASWERYRQYMRYPFDYDMGDLEYIMRLACWSEPKEWKSRFIGKQMDSAGFVATLKSLVKQQAYA